MSKRIKGSIKEASTTKSGETKPSLIIPNRSEPEWWLYHDLGIEGFSSVLTNRMQDVDPKSKARRYYLNHAYVRIKPDFSQMRYENTSDPQPRKVNGCYCGVWQVKDAESDEEMVLWTYTKPNQSAIWENMHIYIKYIINKLRFEGLDIVDKDGYLPVVLKIGKLPTRYASKYVKAVSWDSVIETSTRLELMDVNHPEVLSTYEEFQPKLPNQFEH